MTKKTKRYQKKEPIEHVIDRPDMYVGSTLMRESLEYIGTQDDLGNLTKIVQQKIQVSPAIVRVFVEVLSNAIDNVARSKKTKTPCKTIKIEVDSETGLTSVWNDGDIVPVEFDEDEKCYNHSMIFGQMLTGSNYDDDEDRDVSGRNGLGVKLTNIFSKSFTVKGCDPKNAKILKQTWTNNMRTTDGPVITDKKSKAGYTKVTWTPDFKLFNIESYTPDIIALYAKFALDTAMLTKIKVTFNGETLGNVKLPEYAGLYNTITDETLHIKVKNHEVFVAPSNKYEAISFVNGVYTKLGGNHVEAWAEALLRPVVDKMNKKDKPSITIRDVRQFFRIIILSTVVNPSFDGQNKNLLESPAVKVQNKPVYTNTIMKWSIIDKIRDIISGKEMMVLKKVENKKSGYIKVNGLDQAGNSNRKNGYKCTLNVCEGSSAKTYIVAGLKGKREWDGIYALTGKILNVRKASHSVMANNKVLGDIIKTTGARFGVDYTIEKNFRTMLYGKIKLVVDADTDGSHIEGLYINVIHKCFPSLLERDEPFIVSLKTPIIRISKNGKKNDILFYDDRKYKEFAKTNDTKKMKIKYYKGLGTTKSADVPLTFNKKIVSYKLDENASRNLDKVFGKDTKDLRMTDVRKDWMRDTDNTGCFSLDDCDTTADMTISDFIDNELIKYSRDDCARSLAHMMDGLKLSQRKVLFCAKKKNLTYKATSVKVAQFGGYVAEHSNYHHGEKNLYGTIVNMAGTYIGCNNIPIMYADGQFGTRLEGGKDAADARYIFTKMDEMVPYVFRKEDDPFLEYVVDDGDKVEPEYYAPIIPWVLVNGTSGIATGWSSKVPMYNPTDIVNAVECWIDDKDIPELHPWYRNFKGVIDTVSKQKYITYGILKEKEYTNVVKELPVGMWTDDFKLKCEELLEQKKLDKMVNNSTENDVHFELVGKCDMNSLKLYSYLHTSNMVLIDENGLINKYKNVSDIIRSFCENRLPIYEKRIKMQIKDLEKLMVVAKNKKKFITGIIAKKLVIMNVDEEELILKMESKGFDKIDDTYNYLLSMQTRSFTKKKVEGLKDEVSSIKLKLDTLKATTPKAVWKKELEEFLQMYEVWKNRKE